MLGLNLSIAQQRYDNADPDLEIPEADYCEACGAPPEEMEHEVFNDCFRCLVCDARQDIDYE
jgi:hypothetical protein